MERLVADPRQKTHTLPLQRPHGDRMVGEDAGRKRHGPVLGMDAKVCGWNRGVHSSARVPPGPDAKCRLIDGIVEILRSGIFRKLSASMRSVRLAVA